MNVQPITKIWLLFSFFTSFLVQCMSWSLGNENDFTQWRRLFGWYQRQLQLHAVGTVHLLLDLCLHFSHAVASTFLGLDLCPSCPQPVCAHDGLAAHPRTHAAGWHSACSKRWEANFTRVQMSTGNRFWLASCSMLPMPVPQLELAYFQW